MRISRLITKAGSAAFGFAVHFWLLSLLGMPPACFAETPGDTESPADAAGHELCYAIPEPSTEVTQVSLQEFSPPSRLPSEIVAQVPDYPEGIVVGSVGPAENPPSDSSFLASDPEKYRMRCGVTCPPCGSRHGGTWGSTRPIPWEVFAQGEYVGPARLAHVPVYRLRVDDILEFVYRLSGNISASPYRLDVRDRILVESELFGNLGVPQSQGSSVSPGVQIQSDGTITLRMVGQVPAAGLTLNELRDSLQEVYKKQVAAPGQDPGITVFPLETNSTLQELRAAVDRRYGEGGQAFTARVTPEGTVQLPALGSVPAQGLTLAELEREVESRYAEIVEGLDATAILAERAPRFIFVVGEVKTPGRFILEGPTTVMQAIAMAGSWNVGAHLDHVIVFRRDECWRLMATKVNVHSSLYSERPCPSGEIWLRDSDVVLVPKNAILKADDLIEMVFTRGVYAVFPMTVQLGFTKLSTL